MPGPAKTHPALIELARIAHDHLAIETLETRNRDSLDFHDVAAWNIRAALQAAYDAGRRSRT